MTLVSLNCLRVNKSIYTVNMLTFHPLGCDLLQESLRREIVTHRWNIRDTNKGIVSFLEYRIQPPKQCAIEKTTDGLWSFNAL